MKQQIVSRYDSTKVLFECDVPDELSSGLAMRHALEKAIASRAYLSDANLSGANLSDANLSRAYLSGANLSGATWRNGIALNRAPLQISGLHPSWMICILDNHMQIGCELHSLAEWREFNDVRIVQMDGRDALRFWRKNKAALLMLAHADGRGVEAVAAAEA